jgi:tetratricopeptide (TPR) repeat protein
MQPRLCPRNPTAKAPSKAFRRGAHAGTRTSARCPHRAAPEGHAPGPKDATRSKAVGLRDRLEVRSRLASIRQALLSGIPALDLRKSLGNNSSRRMPQKSCRRKKLSRRESRDLDVKIGFLEGVVRRDTDFVEALQLLGDHYARRGQYRHSLKVDKRLSRLDPRNPLAFYNLACSYSLTGRFDRAVTALARALSLGYRDFKWLARDPDLRKLRQHPLYRPIEARIRKMKIAVL